MAKMCFIKITFKDIRLKAQLGLLLVFFITTFSTLMRAFNNALWHSAGLFFDGPYSVMLYMDTEDVNIRLKLT